MNTTKLLLRRRLKALPVLGVAMFVLITFAAQTGAQTNLLNKAVKKVEEMTRKPATVNKNESRPTNAAGTEAPLPGQAGGRVVFSKQPIDPNNPSGLTNSFTAGDHIYGALILGSSFREFVSDQYVRDSSKGYSVTRPGFEVDFLLDDSPMFDGDTKFVFQLDQKEGAIESVPTENYLIFDIAPDPAQARTYKYDKLFFPLLTAVGRANNKAKAGAQFYSFHISKLGPGSHTVKLVISGTKRIEGEFNISGSSFAFYRQVSDSLDSVASANAGLPKSEWNNPALARSVGVAFKKAPGETVLKVALISPSWFVQKNSLGLIIHRGLFAVVATKDRNGKCYMQKEYFKQMYRGGNRYGATMQDGRSETRQEIPCGNIN